MTYNKQNTKCRIITRCVLLNYHGKKQVKKNIYTIDIEILPHIRKKQNPISIFRSLNSAAKAHFEIITIIKLTNY